MAGRQAKTQGPSGTVAPPRLRMDKAARKAELLEATIDVLADRGIGDFTLADIAQAANASPSLIVVHFGGKENLLTAALELMGREYFGGLHASQFGASRSAAEKLWRLVDAEFGGTYFTPRYLAAWKTFWAATNGRKLYLDLFADQTRHFTAVMTELCRELVAGGDYPGQDSTVLARILDTALGGIWLELTQGPTPLTVPEAQTMARTLLAHLFPLHFTVDGPRPEKAA